MLRAIWNHPQKIIGKCIGTQSLHNLVNFAQNELIKKGFITSQVTIDPQDIQQGSLRLGVQIGRLRKIIVEGEQLSLRGYAATGKPVSLVVNMNTKISETVKNNILSNKGTIQRFDPIKQTLHPY
ncbi:POTRA domain, ShlB-type family protein [Acinetobacter baumannii 1106579]|nr:POTRA domain, ShlB-type family protein [Acinetobacter baumannii 1106579]